MALLERRAAMTAMGLLAVQVMELVNGQGQRSKRRSSSRSRLNFGPELADTRSGRVTFFCVRKRPLGLAIAFLALTEL